MAIRAQSGSVVVGILATLTKLRPVMNFQVGGIVSPSQKWRLGTASLANSIRPPKDSLLNGSIHIHFATLMLFKMLAHSTAP